MPQFFPSEEQVPGTQVHWFETQERPVPHVPHESSSEHPSLMRPHTAFSSVHVFAVQVPTPHTFTPPAPQVSLAPQLPQLSVWPHPSSMVPQFFPAVAQVRGLGLLLAAELVPGIDARRVAADALRKGLVVNAVTPSALRLAPSLLVTDEEIDRALRVLAAALDAVVETTPGLEATS